MHVVTAAAGLWSDVRQEESLKERGGVVQIWHYTRREKQIVALAVWWQLATPVGTGQWEVILVHADSTATLGRQE
jgi:hypothetical protein